MDTFRKAFASVSVVLGLLATAPAQAQNLLLNGDFDQPILPLGTTSVPANTYGWIYNGAALASVASGSLYATPSQGCDCAQVALLEGFDSEILQYFTPSTSGEYELSWQDAGSATNLGAPYTQSY